jgi:hypothetical protein
VTQVAKTPLRVAQAGETVRPKTVSEAASGGSQLELLVAVRSRVAKAVEDPGTPARDLAALTKRLIDVAKEIEAIKAEAEDGDTSGIPDEDFDAAAL